MTKIDFIKGMKLLQGSYSKDFTEDELQIWYIQFENINTDTFYKAINNIVRTSKFMPSIAEILEKCSEENNTKRFEIIDYMKEQNYFKEETEYNKAITWLEKNIIPEWFKNDMKKYYKKQIEMKEQLKLKEN